MIRLQTYSEARNPAVADRRRSIRIQVAAQIEIKPADSDVPLRLQTTDLSMGGCYVETTIPLDVGTKVNIVLWLHEQKVTTGGVIVTRHPQFGNGIQFVEMSAENAERLGVFIDTEIGPLGNTTKSAPC